MWRQFKRQLRQWWGELEGKWLNLTTFYRIVLAIVCTMALAFAFRTMFMDPIQTSLADIQKKLSSNGVPGYVPAPDHDDEIIRMRLKVEGLQDSLDKTLEQERQAIPELEPLKPSQVSEAAAATGRIVSEAGLRVLRFHEIHGSASAKAGTGKEKKVKKKKALKDVPLGLTLLRHRYELLGTFAGVYGFLNNVSGLPWPFCLSEIDISASPAATGGQSYVNSQVLIRLSFEQTFYCYDYERLGKNR